MSALKVALYGSAGRMGQEILNLVKEDGGKNFYVCVSHDQKINSQSFETHAPLAEWSKRDPHVVVDFSSPLGALGIAKWCKENKCPLLVGATGFTDKQMSQLKYFSKYIPVFYSPNMSIGVEAIRAALQTLLKNLGPCDIGMEEIHHKNKKDKPSGTAKLLYNTVLKNLKKGQSLTPPVSLRGGDVFGVHTVFFFSKGEIITLTHRAQSRRIFAQGAIEAAGWLVKQKKGFYMMSDLNKGI